MTPNQQNWRLRQIGILGKFCEMKFGLWGRIDPHTQPNHLSSCEILLIRGRQRTETRLYGGEGGIRTLVGLMTHTPLAGARLQPLGHLSMYVNLQPKAVRSTAKVAKHTVVVN